MFPAQTEHGMFEKMELILTFEDRQRQIASISNPSRQHRGYGSRGQPVQPAGKGDGLHFL